MVSLQKLVFGLSGNLWIYRTHIAVYSEQKRRFSKCHTSARLVVISDTIHKAEKGSSVLSMRMQMVVEKKWGIQIYMGLETLYIWFFHIESSQQFVKWIRKTLYEWFSMVYAQKHLRESFQYEWHANFMVNLVCYAFRKESSLYWNSVCQTTVRVKWGSHI